MDRAHIYTVGWLVTSLVSLPSHEAIHSYLALGFITWLQVRLIWLVSTRNIDVD